MRNYMNITPGHVGRVAGHNMQQVVFDGRADGVDSKDGIYLHEIVGRGALYINPLEFTHLEQIRPLCDYARLFRRGQYPAHIPLDIDRREIKIMDMLDTLD